MLNIGSVIAFGIWIKSSHDDRVLQEKVKKMYDSLNLSEKEKWKNEKKKSLFSAIFFSFVIAIFLEIIYFLTNPSESKQQGVFEINILIFISFFSVFLIIIYMVIDELNQRKWLKLKNL